MGTYEKRAPDLYASWLFYTYNAIISFKLFQSTGNKRMSKTYQSLRFCMLVVHVNQP